MGNKKGIFEMWLKNFAFTVFMQSFHAVFFMFILRLIAGIYAGTAINNENSLYEILWNEQTSNVDGIVGIVTIIAVLMLTKMEKFFKDTFGVGSPSFMGGIGAEAMKGFNTFKHGADLVRRTAEPFKRYSDVQKEKAQNQAKINKAQSRLKALSGNNEDIGALDARSESPVLASEKTSNVTASQSAALNPSSNGAISGANITINGGNVNVNGKNTNGGGSDAQKWKLEDDLEALYAKQNDLETEEKALPLKAFSRLGTTIASVGYGVGAGEDLNAAIQVANMVDIPLDALGDKVADRNANAKMYAINRARAADANRSGDKKMSEVHEKNASSNKVYFDRSAIKELKTIWKEGRKDLASNVGKRNTQTVTGKNSETIKINSTVKNVVTPKTQIKKIDDAF